MADNTKIEWCDATLNLWHGCTKVSTGCKNCYAEALNDGRFNKGNWGPGGVRRETKSWAATLRAISRRAKAEGRRLRVFCQSMSDTFEGPETMGGRESENWATVRRLQDELLSAVLEHPELDFLLLTKRPENVLGVCHRHDDPDGLGGGPRWEFPPNLWLGTSVEDQAAADARIPHLLNVPARVRFLSCEPLLGPVRLNYVAPEPWNGGDGSDGETWIDSLRGVREYEDSVGHGEDDPGAAIHWVIGGFESGANARPGHPDWAKSLRDQCEATSVSFHWKQNGEWATVANEAFGLHSGRIGFMRSDGSRWDVAPPDEDSDCVTIKRVGVGKSGRDLYGRVHDAFPEVAR